MDNDNHTINNITNHMFWLFLLQGLFFIGLGVLIYFYPQIIVWFVIAGFVLVGVISIFI